MTAVLRRPRVELALKKRPQQQRAKLTFDAIVDACGALIVEHGYAAVTTNHIAERAGVGIASLYEYFPGKDAVVGELAERLVGRVVGRLEAAIPDILAAPPAEAAQRWIAQIYAILERERRLVGAFVWEVPFAHQLPAVREIAPRLHALSRGLGRRAGLAIAEDAAALHLMINLVSSTVLQLVLDPPTDVSREVMIAALAAHIAGWADAAQPARPAR